MLYRWEPIDKNRKMELEKWRNERDRWAIRAQECEEFYYNDVEGTFTTYTAEQKKSLEEKGLAPISLNSIYPLIAQKLAYIVSAKSSFKLVSIDSHKPELDDLIVKMDKVIKYVLYHSRDREQVEEFIKDMLLTGIGTMIVIPDVENELGVSYKYAHYSTIILDSNVRDKTLKDMTGFWYEKEVMKKEIEAEYGAYLEQVSEVLGVNASLDNVGIGSNFRRKNSKESIGENRKYTIREYYEKAYSEMIYVQDPETKKITRTFLENLPEDVIASVVPMIVKTELGIYIKKETYIEETKIMEEILPIKTYPIAVGFFEWGGKPYRSYGAVHYVMDMQKVIDKSVQLMILNGSLTNNATYTAPIGSIPENHRKNWEELGNKPGVIKEYNPVITDIGILRPEREPITPISNFYPTLIDMMKGGIIESTGMYPSISGNPQENKIEIFRTLQSYQNAAMQRITLATTHLNYALMQLGNVMLEYIINMLEPEQVIKIIDEFGNEQEIVIFQLSYILLPELKYKFMMIPAEASHSYKLGMSDMLMKIAQTTSDPYKRDLYIQEALELSEVHMNKELQQKIDTVTQIAQQLQMLQQEIDRLKELNKQYENRALIAEYNAKLYKLYADGGVQLMKKQKEIEAEMERASMEEMALQNAKNSLPTESA